MPGTFGRDAAGEGQIDGGRKVKRIQRYDDGEKQRYFRDDDRALDDLVREQRHHVNDNMDANLAENIARKAKFRYGLSFYPKHLTWFSDTSRGSIGQASLTGTLKVIVLQELLMRHLRKTQNRGLYHLLEPLSFKCRHSFYWSRGTSWWLHLYLSPRLVHVLTLVTKPLAESFVICKIDCVDAGSAIWM